MRLAAPDRHDEIMRITAVYSIASTAEDIEALLNEQLEAIGSPEIDFAYAIDDSGGVPMAVATANYEVPLHVPFVPDLALHFSAESVAPAPAG